MRRLVVQVTGAMMLPYLAILLVMGGALALGLYDQVMRGGYAPLMLANLVVGGVATGLILLYAPRLGGLPLRRFGFTWERSDLLFSAGAVALTLAMALLYMLALDGLGLRPVVVLAPVWLAIAAGIIGQAGVFFEEVLFRGYVLARLQPHTGVAWALGISTVLFCLGHIPVRGVSPLIATWLLAGVIYGLVYLKSGSLWVAGVAHVAHNVAADLFLYSGNGVSLLQFATPLNGLEKTLFEVILSALILGLTLRVYGRGTNLLAPSPRLARLWTTPEAAPEALTTVAPRPGVA